MADTAPSMGPGPDEEAVPAGAPAPLPVPTPGADGTDGTDGADGARGAAAGSGKQRRARPVFLLVGVVLAVALGIGLFTGVGTGRSGGRPGAGDQVPSFTLPSVGGGRSVGVPADGGGNGRPVVLLFFASWCKPCQTEVPAIASTYRHQQVHRSRLATTVALIGVVGNDPTATALRFIRKSGVTFPSGADKSYAVTEGLFYFTGLPEAVSVSATGTITEVHYGPLSAAAFVRWQRKLLGGG